MKSDEDDPVISEIPVYLNKSLSDELYILQFIVRPSYTNYDSANILKARIRPNAGHVEMEVGLNTRSATFDQSKGEQIAVNVDGAFREHQNAEKNYFKSNVMDKLLLTSTKAVTDVKRYAIGIYSDGALHLTPVHSVLAVRPSFAYLDIADKRAMHENKDGDETYESDRDEAKKVTVRFEKPERNPFARERSYNYLQKQIQDEPWIDLEYNNCGSSKSKYQLMRMLSHSNGVPFEQLALSKREYLLNLVPGSSQSEVMKFAAPEQLSLKDLHSLPLQESVDAIVSRVKMIKHSEVYEMLKYSAGDPTAITKLLQHSAVLVQGNWVVKSSTLFPKDGTSERGVSNEILQRTRNYILYLFTKDVNIPVEKLETIPDVSSVDLKEILNAIAEWNSRLQTWLFKMPVDDEFIRKYPEVVNRQHLIWNSWCEQWANMLR